MLSLRDFIDLDDMSWNSSYSQYALHGFKNGSSFPVVYVTKDVCHDINCLVLHLGDKSIKNIVEAPSPDTILKYYVNNYSNPDSIAVVFEEKGRYYELCRPTKQGLNVKLNINSSCFQISFDIGSELNKEVLKNFTTSHLDKNELSKFDFEDFEM